MGRDIDLEIGQFIEAQDKRTWGYQTHTLSGELGFLALSKILNTSRCFWQDTSCPPLQPGETRELQLGWRKEKNGDCRLVMSVQPEEEMR